MATLAAATARARATALSAAVLYDNDNGRIICGHHIGMASHGAIHARPHARSWTTHGPDGRVCVVDVPATQALFTAHGLGPVKCESCP